MGKDSKEGDRADCSGKAEEAGQSVIDHSSRKHKKKKKKNKKDLKDSDHDCDEELGKKERHTVAIEHEEKDSSRKKKKKKKREKQESSSDSYEEDYGGKRKKPDTAEGDKSVETNDTKEKAPVDEKPVDTGQWSSANFGDSDRQEKFFRLMGGYKKKADDDSKSQGKHASRLMTKSQEKNMEERLETQYSEALEKKRTSRGMGLGYHAETDPATKDFHIDKDKVRSIKFEAAKD